MSARPTTKPVTQPRAIAANIVLAVVDNGEFLDAALARNLLGAGLDARDTAWVQEISYGLLRRFWQLEDAAANLLNKPLKRKDRDLYFLLLVGIYQLAYMRTPQHAALSETVDACSALGKGWAKSLVNGCLRTYLRSGASIDDSGHNYSHPDWLADRIKLAWPGFVDKILVANNQPPDMCLRVNLLLNSRGKYLEILADAGIDAHADMLVETGITLSRGVPIDSIPGFWQGHCSVQDTAAQLAVLLLNPGRGDRVLDSCAAPGGKSGHILEHTHGEASLTALDISEKRMQLVADNIARIGMRADCMVANATQLNDWWDGNPFDSVLLDAPCSGTGVIRRHPDIRHHRTPDDIRKLMKVQSELLDKTWQTLRPDGRLLYVTCSILPEENEQQAKAFVQRHADATVLDIVVPEALKCEPGYQTLPGVQPCDGFYFCLFEKTATLA